MIREKGKIIDTHAVDEAKADSSNFIDRQTDRQTHTYTHEELL